MVSVRRSVVVTPLMMLFASAAWGQTVPGSPVNPSPAAGSSAGAAVPQRAPQTLPASSSGNNLEQIVVTAQRRSENLQKAAVAVDVVKGSQLVASGVTNIDTLSKLVPAVDIVGTAQAPLVFIRGVGNFTFQPNSDPTTAFNFDGVYIGRPGSTEGLFYDLQRIEVLKGPQGTLYGRNATGGAINVLPVQPSTAGLSGYETTSFGNYGTVTTEGGVNIPITDTAALRVSGTYDRHDGYFTDDTSNENSYGVRAQFKDDITPDLTVRLLADYAHDGGTGLGGSYIDSYALDAKTGQYVTTPFNGSPSLGAFSPAEQAFRETVTAGTAGRLLGPLTNYPFQNDNFYDVHGVVDWRTDIGTISFLPAWFHGDRNFLNTTGFENGDVNRSDQYSFEARLVSDPGRIIDYNLGAFFYDERIKDSQYLTAQSEASFVNSAFNTRSPAVYGRLTWHITDKLRLTGGLRYTEDAKSFNSQADALGILCVLPTGCPTAPLLPLTRSIGQQPYNPSTSPLVIPALGHVLPVAPGVFAFNQASNAIDADSIDRITYRAAVEYDVAPRSFVYASVETGYRSGGFNAASGFETFQPESIIAYTLGSKNRFLDNRVQLNLEAFDWEYRDQQLSFLTVDTTGRPDLVTENVGRETIQGFEAEGQVLITPDTLFTTDLQYLNSYYDTFVYQQAAIDGYPFVGCAVSLASTTKYNVNCAGKQGFNSPRWTINAGVQQTVPLEKYDFVFSINTQYKTGRYTGFEYIAAEHQGATTQTDAQASVSPKNARWAVSLFVHNLEDNRYQTYATPVPTEKLVEETINDPRTYGVRLSVKF